MSALSGIVMSMVQKKLVALKYEAEAVESILSDAVDEVEVSICNYCNLEEVPAALRFVWTNMVMDYCRWFLELQSKRDSTSTPGSSSSTTILTSLKEGDTTLAFAVDMAAQESQAVNAHTLAGKLDQIVMNYADQLNRFRRVEW